MTRFLDIFSGFFLNSGISFSGKNLGYLKFSFFSLQLPEHHVARRSPLREGGGGPPGPGACQRRGGMCDGVLLLPRHLHHPGPVHLALLEEKLAGQPGYQAPYG